MFKKKKQSGFIALTSVLLFGALILIMGLSMASTSISEQAMTGYEKGGEKAVSAANSCVDIGVSRVKSGEMPYHDTVVAFTEVGEHTWTVPAGVTEVDVLVVGGGGGGAGGDVGGGGGAGGLIFENIYVNEGESFPIVVGNGGPGLANEGGANGENSSAFNLVSIGGGGGAYYPYSGNYGGSGGGAGREGTIGGSSEAGQGNDGGRGYYVVGYGAGGGGGGAGGKGRDAGETIEKGGDGGDGLYFGNIFGENYGENGWFAGGGGGNTHRSGSYNPGIGGIGGGADGSSGAVGISGIVNTGGGGGASRAAETGIGGNGGSGIVLIGYSNINLYDDVYCNLSFSKDPNYSYRVKVTGTATTNTGQRSFSHTEYAYVDNHDFIPGLVGYWPMNEGRDHAVYNKVSDDRESYLDFDGVDDYVDLGDSSNYPLSGAIVATVSMWVKQTSLISDKSFFGWHNPSGQRLYFANKDNYWDMGIADNSWGIGHTGTLEPATTDWTHITVVFNGSSAKMYVNTKETITKTYTSINPVGVLPIGTMNEFGNSKYSWNGLIDDVRIYNRALSETEIQKLYNETENITDGLVGYWEMDETFGDLAIDSSGNNNYGTIYGAKRGGSKGKYVGIEAFTEVGEHTWTVPAGVTEVDVLVVGGGGGGGSASDTGGGGGGGGLIFESINVVPASSVSIIVGSGGDGGYAGPGSNGANSSAFGIVALGGGGGGGSSDTSSGDGLDGGSGGGSNRGGIGGSSLNEQGNAGGVGSDPGPGDYQQRGGGGGGASVAGVSSLSQGSLPPDGGDGIYLGHIFGDNYGEDGWFAGGGAGGYGANAIFDPSRNPRGGIGGGADAFEHSSIEDNAPGLPGMANTGGGGSGDGTNAPLGGGDGGSGVVIVRYTKWVDGRNDKALDFDGVSNYVEVADDAIFNFGTNQGLTFGGWVKTTGTSDSTFLEKYSPTTNTGYFIFLLNSGIVRMGIKDINNNYPWKDLSKKINDGQWHHLVLVRDVDVNMIRGYIDGQEDTNSPWVDTTNSTIESTSPIRMGYRTDNTYPFNGQIDDVRIYNRALTEDEIKFLYQRGLEYHVNR